MITHIKTSGIFQHVRKVQRNFLKREGRTFCQVSNKAYDFKAQAINKKNEIVDIQLSSFFGNKYCCLLFYPLNFTFVCPTELIEYNKHVKEFEKRNAELLGISVDSVYSHLTWKNMPKEQGGIGNVNFTLISDISKDISKNYQVLHNDSIALRGLFIIDKEGIVRYKSVNDLSVGRNVHETLRLLDSIIHVDTSGHVCPSNWKKGEKSFKPDQDSLVDYLKSQ